MKALCKSYKIPLWYFSSNLAFAWWQTIGRYRKVEMNNKKFNFSEVGRAFSIKQQILARIRKVTGETIDWELLHWLATGAPDGMYKSIWEKILGAWQVALEEKKEHERMEKLVWNFSPKPGTWKHANTTFPSIEEGWRLPTSSELIFAIKTGTFWFCKEERLYWARENNGQMFVVSSDGSILVSNGDVSKLTSDETHYICHVRDLRVMVQ